MEGRFGFPAGELRTRTVRGVALTAGALVLFDGLVLLQGLIVTRLLGPSDIGLYGIVSVTLVSILMLKRVGIDEAFVQQEEDEQESEFQRAFTLELGLSAVFSGVLCLSAPILVLIYGEDELLPLTLAVAYLPLALALQSPGWIFFRRMDYLKQRSLQGIVPVVTFVVTIPLAATGFGVWSLVVGPLAGNLAGAIAAIVVSPYRLKLRFDRDAMRRYVRFSGPVFVTTACWLWINQGQLLAFDVDRGLAGAGFITLAATLTRYADRADQIVAAAIYPAVCALQGRTERLTELFVKSNRATLLWTLPFAAGLVLFAPDLVTFVLGDSWEPAIVLLQGLALTAGLMQVGFNWFTFYRAHADTRPTAVEALVGAAGFTILAVPGLLLWGSWGFVAGRLLAVAVQQVVRGRYVRRLLPDAPLLPIALRALRPVVVAIVPVLALRAALWGSSRTIGQAVAEVALFVIAYVAAALWLERELIAEIRRTWRGGGLSRLAEVEAEGPAPVTPG
jgi:O-antigen/teichoic acid export membrane protein